MRYNRMMGVGSKKMCCIYIIVSMQKYKEKGRYYANKSKK